MDNHRAGKKSSNSSRKFGRFDSKQRLSHLQLKARYERLVKENIQLETEIRELQRLGLNDNLRPQMEALHEYNEMKDVTQIVLGLLSDVESICVKDLHTRYNLPTD